MTAALLMLAFFALDAGVVVAALAWLSDKRARNDRTDARHQRRLR